MITPDQAELERRVEVDGMPRCFPGELCEQRVMAIVEQRVGGGGLVSFSGETDHKYLEVGLKLKRLGSYRGGGWALCQWLVWGGTCRWGRPKYLSFG